MAIRRCRWLIGVLGLGAQALAAQQVRGEVRDSSTRQPVAGAIVMMIDSTGRSLARNLTDEAGRYFVLRPAGATRLRVVRLGFRPREVTLAAGAATIDVALAPIPTFLQAVSVTAAAGCPARADRAKALALFEQARTGLLATIVAREANPARMVLYGYERTMDGTSDRVTRQTVHVDSAARATVAFGAALNAADFVRQGFVVENLVEKTFLAPDADVLLSDAFTAGYCFAIAKPSRERPNQVGLAFEAAGKRRGRVDVEGALWVDTVAHSLADVEFRYVGLGGSLEIYDPGGRIAFRQMPNGAVLVDRWKLRLIGSVADTVGVMSPSGRPQQSTVRAKYFVSETGGEIAHARWSDGKTWHATLGRARILATNAAGGPAVGAVLHLDDTPYLARTDSAGVAEFHDLIPGPYKLVVKDPQLAAVGLTIPTSVAFTAARDTMRTGSLRVPSASDFIFARCASERRTAPKDTTRLLVRFMTYTDDPVDLVNWKVSRGRGSIFDAGTTGGDGMFQICNADLRPGTQLGLIASRSGYYDAAEEVVLRNAVTVVKVVMGQKP